MITNESATPLPFSGTLESVSTLSAPSARSSSGHPVERGYGALWRGVPRELGFLLLTMPIAVAGLAVLQSVFWTGIGTLIIYVGLFLTLAALYIARGFGTLELVRLRWSGRPAIERPAWRSDVKGRGFWRATFGPFVNGHYWLYLLHGLIVNPIVSIATWTITVVWVSVGLGGVTYWFWAHFTQTESPNFSLSRIVFEAVFPGTRATFDPIVGDAVLQFALGVVMLVTLPFVTRGLTMLHNGIASGLLGAWVSEALQREVADLSASRGAAVTAEDQSLRRLERDLHDGPQQRLVRLQMDLASAERKLDASPEEAKALLAEARSQAADALDELRALSRGFAPPILQDRGLVAALESLAGLSLIPVSVQNDLDATLVLPSEIERNAYFVAAELLANVAKHSGATAATVRVAVAVRAPEDAPAVAATPRLVVAVTDNGRGGAVIAAEHGLSGLRERLTGLRGTLTIVSPPGGPTTVEASIPLPAATA